jgi:sodium-dependent phosphate cotransporter
VTASDDPRVTIVPGRDLPAERIAVRADLEDPTAHPWWQRVLFGVLGIFLFVTALGLMKEGAAGLIPSLEGSIFTDNPWSTLGLGWLGAFLVLSGSPVAASALTLLDGGAISVNEAFTMLTGSRLGASFVVVVVGVVYALRNKEQGERRAPISIGILSLLMTATIYLPAAAVGYLLLQRGTFDNFDIGTSPELTSATDTAFGWSVDLLLEVLPSWSLFPIGVAVLVLGFNCIDRVLPQLGSGDFERREVEWTSRLWPMFLAGCAVTMVTLSVSVSLTLLVPLVAKGHVRRSNTLPYIAGANITTLADTLVAAILIGNQDAVRVVVAVTSVVTVFTLIVLLTAYQPLRRTLLSITRWVLASNRRLAGSTVVLFAVPVALIAI